VHDVLIRLGLPKRAREVHCKNIRNERSFFQGGFQMRN